MKMVESKSFLSSVISISTLYVKKYSSFLKRIFRYIAQKVVILSSVSKWEYVFNIFKLVLQLLAYPSTAYTVDISNKAGKIKHLLAKWLAVDEQEASLCQYNFIWNCCLIFIDVEMSLNCNVAIVI